MNSLDESLKLAAFQENPTPERAEGILLLFCAALEADQPPSPEVMKYFYAAAKAILAGAPAAQALGLALPRGKNRLRVDSLEKRAQEFPALLFIHECLKAHSLQGACETAAAKFYDGELKWRTLSNRYRARRAEIAYIAALESWCRAQAKTPRVARGSVKRTRTK
jgi:hypothetical protein